MGAMEERKRTVWETLLELDIFNYHAVERDQGAVALAFDVAKVFERVSFPVVWAWETHLKISKILCVLCVHFEHQRRAQFEGCAAEPLQTITAILPRSFRAE